MNKIKVTCDSTCDLPESLYDKYEITVLPLGICLGDDFRYDCVNVSAGELCDYTEKTGKLANISPVPIGDYLKCFQSYVKRGFQIIHIGLSSELSASYRNACIAARSAGNVTVIDSRSLSSGAGHLALLAVELAAADYTAAEITAALKDIRQKLDASFLLQTLEYLHKDGRCSGLTARRTSLLKLRPEIVMSDGKMHIGKKYHGDMEHSILTYIRDQLEGQKNLQLDRIIVTHSGVPEKIIAKAKELIRELQPFEQILEASAGSAITSRFGPGCLGILFLRNGKK